MDFVGTAAREVFGPVVDALSRVGHVGTASAVCRRQDESARGVMAHWRAVLAPFSIAVGSQDSGQRRMKEPSPRLQLLTPAS
jgi:hypothetical protein